MTPLGNATTPTASRRRNRYALMPLVVVLLLITAAVGAEDVSPVHGAAPVPATESPAVSPTKGPRTSDRLKRLADTLDPADIDWHKGRYYLVHLRRWVLDTTGRPASRPMVPAVQSVEMRRWTAEDGSGRGMFVEPPLDYDLSTADPHHRSTEAEFASPEPRSIIYGPEHLGGTTVPTPPSTNPNTLTKQLTARPMSEGPAGILLAVDELFTVHPTPRAVRAAVLRVLADVTGLRYHGGVVDRLGRPGIAVSLDRENVRYSLIFDPTSGQLLASEQLLIGQHEYLDVPTGRVIYCTLFIELTRRADFT